MARSRCQQSLLTGAGVMADVVVSHGEAGSIYFVFIRIVICWVEFEVGVGVIASSSMGRGRLRWLTELIVKVIVSTECRLPRRRNSFSDGSFIVLRLNGNETSLIYDMTCPRGLFPRPKISKCHDHRLLRPDSRCWTLFDQGLVPKIGIIRP